MDNAQINLEGILIITSFCILAVQVFDPFYFKIKRFLQSVFRGYNLSFPCLLFQPLPYQ